MMSFSTGLSLESVPGCSTSLGSLDSLLANCSEARQAHQVALYGSGQVLGLASSWPDGKLVTLARPIERLLTGHLGSKKTSVED